jgi:hypothetical protein
MTTQSLITLLLAADLLAASAATACEQRKSEAQ